MCSIASLTVKISTASGGYAPWTPNRGAAPAPRRAPAAPLTPADIFSVLSDLPTIPTQALDKLYLYLEGGAGLNATITDHIRLTPNILLGYLYSHFGAKQGQKMMPWGITSENPRECLEASCGLCLGMPQGIMRSGLISVANNLKLACS